MKGTSQGIQKNGLVEEMGVVKDGWKEPSDLQKRDGQAGWMVEKAQRGRSGGRDRVGQ